MAPLTFTRIEKFFHELVEQTIKTFKGEKVVDEGIDESTTSSYQRGNRHSLKKYSYSSKKNAKFNDKSLFTTDDDASGKFQH